MRVPIRFSCLWSSVSVLGPVGGVFGVGISCCFVVLPLAWRFAPTVPPMPTDFRRGTVRHGSGDGTLTGRLCVGCVWCVVCAECVPDGCALARGRWGRVQAACARRAGWRLLETCVRLPTSRIRIGTFTAALQHLPIPSPPVPPRRRSGHVPARRHGVRTQRYPRGVAPPLRVVGTVGTGGTGTVAPCVLRCRFLAPSALERARCRPTRLRVEEVEDGPRLLRPGHVPRLPSSGPEDRPDGAHGGRVSRSLPGPAGRRLGPGTAGLGTVPPCSP